MKYLSYVARLLLLKILDLSAPGLFQMDSFRGSRLFFTRIALMSIIYTTEEE